MPRECDHHAAAPVEVLRMRPGRSANAVATVIYTHSLPAQIAVVWSGCFNFLGVLLSSGAVAFGIISLMPVELILPGLRRTGKRPDMQPPAPLGIRLHRFRAKSFRALRQRKGVLVGEVLGKDGEHAPALHGVGIRRDDGGEIDLRA